MKFETFVDIARTIVPDSNPNDIALRLNGYFDEIALEIDIEKRTAAFTSVTDQVIYPLRNFVDDGDDAVIGDRLIRLLSVRVEDVTIRHINEATYGDHCFRAKYEDLEVGKFAQGLSEGKPAFDALPADREISIDYSARPVITIASEELPSPQFHNALTYRLRADMWAERSRWDMYGAYNRRYEQAFQRVRKAVNRGHGNFHAESNRSNL